MTLRRFTTLFPLLATAALALLPAILAGGCTGGSGDEQTVDMTPQASAAAKTGLTREAEERARKIAAEASGKAR